MWRLQGWLLWKSAPCLTQSLPASSQTDTTLQQGESLKRTCDVLTSDHISHSPVPLRGSDREIRSAAQPGKEGEVEWRCFSFHYPDLIGNKVKWFPQTESIFPHVGNKWVIFACPVLNLQAFYFIFPSLYSWLRAALMGAWHPDRAKQTVSLQQSVDLFFNPEYLVKTKI